MSGRVGGKELDLILQPRREKNDSSEFIETFKIIALI